MTDSAQRRLPDFDTTRPNIARVNDYLLGGKDNFAADRQAAEELLAVAPQMKSMIAENRRFLGRAVRFLAEQGIRQFFDIGSGLPTRQNTHEVALAADPSARVIYVDNDPVVISHSRAILARDERTAVIEGDVLHPKDLLADSRVHRIIDLGQPVAILILGALHSISDSDDPYRCVAWLRDAIPSGSYLAICHAIFDERPKDARPIEEVYQRITGRPGVKGLRTHAEVLRFFDGFELVEPGLVNVRQWRPDNPTGVPSNVKICKVGGVGRKP